MSITILILIALIYCREKKQRIILISRISGMPLTTSISHMVCQPGRHPTTVAVLWSIRLPLFTLYHMGPSYCKGFASPFLPLHPHLPIMFLSSLYKPVLWPLSIAVILVFSMFSYFIDEFLRLFIIRSCT